MEHRRRCIAALLGALLAGGAGEALAQTAVTAGSGAPAMPKRWGVGITYYQQRQPYGIDALTLAGLPPEIAAGIDIEAIEASNFTETTHVTFDYWLFPFLDLQLLAGTITSDTDLALSRVNVGLPLQDLEVESKGNVFGAGFTLAYGHERLFGTFTAQYTSAELDQVSSSVKALVLTPKVGWRLGTKGAAWLGAMYQKPEEKHEGSYLVPPFPVPLGYAVTLTNEEKWGYLAGASYGLTDHWVLTAEGGFGGRDSVLVHLDYRW